jgi:ankyrin repeat protein
VNARNKKGITALMLATERGYTELIELLKRAGATK